MTRTKYFWTIGALILGLSAVARYGWYDKLPSVKIVTGEKQIAYDQDLMEQHLYNSQLDGTLRLMYSLSDDPDLRAASFKCILTHRIEETPGRTARSQWELPFTESYLVPCNSTDLQWCPPNGSNLVFKKGRITPIAIFHGAEIWALKKISPSTYDIYNNRGDRFSYEGGLLSSVATSNGRRYRATTRGGLITSVTEASGPDSGKTLFSAEFDDFGHCTKLQFAGRSANRFEWDDQGFLKTWRPDSGDQRSFQYKDGLLVSVTGAGSEVFPITWAENKKYLSYGIQYGKPVYVTSAGSRSYALSYSLHGIRIAIRGLDKNQDGIVVGNFNQKTITQEFGGQKWFFSFFDSEWPFRSKMVEVTDPAK